jgi:hypothetical protein
MNESLPTRRLSTALLVSAFVLCGFVTTGIGARDAFA